VAVNSGNKYIVDKMTYSSPYVTKEARNLLDEIGERLMKGVRKKAPGRPVCYHFDDQKN